MTHEEKKAEHARLVARYDIPNTKGWRRSQKMESLSLGNGGSAMLAGPGKESTEEYIEGGWQQELDVWASRAEEPDTRHSGSENSGVPIRRTLGDGSAGMGSRLQDDDRLGMGIEFGAMPGDMEVEVVERDKLDKAKPTCKTFSGVSFAFRKGKAWGKFLDPFPDRATDINCY